MLHQARLLRRNGDGSPRRFLGLHDFELRLHAKPHTLQIQRDLRVEVLLRIVRKTTQFAQSGCVVESKVHAAGAVNGGLYCGGDLRCVRHICWFKESASAIRPQLLFDLFTQLWSSGGYDNVCTCLGNRAAVALPIPALPPVMKTTFPASDSGMRTS